MLKFRELWYYMATLDSQLNVTGLAKINHVSTNYILVLCNYQDIYPYQDKDNSFCYHDNSKFLSDFPDTKAHYTKHAGI